VGHRVCQKDHIQERTQESWLLPPLMEMLRPRSYCKNLLPKGESEVGSESRSPLYVRRNLFTRLE